VISKERGRGREREREREGEIIGALLCNLHPHIYVIIQSETDNPQKKRHR